MTACLLGSQILLGLEAHKRPSIVSSSEMLFCEVPLILPKKSLSLWIGPHTDSPQTDLRTLTSFSMLALIMIFYVAHFLYVST